MIITRPVLRYHGGKWRLAPWIISHFPEHSIYVEPFGGGASVLMSKNPARVEVYNDVDGDVVNVFRVLRDPKMSAELEHGLTYTPFSRVEFYASYEPTSDSVERARRTICKAFMGFGTTSLRKYRTGFRAKMYEANQTGVRDWPNYPNMISAFHQRLRNVLIEQDDYAAIIARHDSPSTLFYCDPPYVPSTRSTMRKYPDGGDTAYLQSFTDEQHRELAEVLRGIKGMAIISGYPCECYDDLYSGWKKLECNARADKAIQRVEVLWISPRAAERGQQTLFHHAIND